MKVNRINLSLGGGCLLQIANRTPIQSMSYLIDTPDGGVVVIDGGNDSGPDGDHLYDLLKDRGKHVDLWIITHIHDDHYGALLYLMQQEWFDVTVDRVCIGAPSDEWFACQEAAEKNLRFLSLVRERFCIYAPQIGDRLLCRGLEVEFISTPQTYKNLANINASSLIFKIHFPKREVLFLGDFDKSAQAEFMQRCDAERLPCEIVQMAHHGQAGVNRDFYEIIRPSICLYCAPQWLWENNKYACDDPATAGKGHFETLVTRQWMEEIGVQASYGHFGGDYLFF